MMGMPPAIAIASWHSLMEITGGVRKRFLNASFSAMMARAWVVRSSFSFGVKRLISAHPLFIYDSKVGDEHLLPTQCHGHAQSCHVPATRNLNCPSAITDGSLRHALPSPCSSSWPQRPDRTGHPPQSLSPPVFPLKGFFRLQNRLSATIITSLGASPRRPRRSGAVAYLSVEMIPLQVGAGLGSLDPRLVLSLSREVTS